VSWSCDFLPHAGDSGRRDSLGDFLPRAGDSWRSDSLGDFLPGAVIFGAVIFGLYRGQFPPTIPGLLYRGQFPPTLSVAVSFFFDT
jgi:hypothetical protein